MKVGDEVLIEIEGKYEVRVITQIASDSSSQDVKMIHKKEKSDQKATLARIKMVTVLKSCTPMY